MEEKQINRWIGLYVVVIGVFALPLLLAFIFASWGVTFTAWHWMLKVLLGT